MSLSGRASIFRWLLIFLMAAGILAPAAPVLAQDDVAAANIAVVTRLVEEVVNQRDYSGLAEIVGPGYTQHRYGESTTYDSVEGVAAYFDTELAFFESFVVTIDDIMAVDDRVVARFTANVNDGQATATGIYIARLENGLIVEDWENYDIYGLMAQLGMLPAPEAAPIEPQVIAEGFSGPMGILMDADGNLWVIESGMGGDQQFSMTDPQTGEEVTVSAGNTARIVMIAPDGTQTEVAALPSIVLPEDTSGGNRLAILDGELYATSGAWVEGAGDERLPLVAAVVHIGDELTEVANTWDTEAANNPDGFILEAHPYGLAAGPDGLLWVADAGANALYTVDPTSGEVTLVTVFDGIPGPLPNPFRGDAMEMDPVPTGVAFGEDGTVYVSLLSGFPFPPGAAKVVAVGPDGEVSDYATGLTMPTDLRMGPDGNLYAVQIGIFTEQGPIFNSGSVVRIMEGDASEVVLSGLSFPTSLDFDADGNAYVTINGVGAPGSGAVVMAAGLTDAAGMPVADARAAAMASTAPALPETAMGPEVPDSGYWVEDLGDGLYVVSDGAYQAAFLTTGEGVIVIDAPPNLGQMLPDAIAATTDEPITHVIYSHAHADHIGSASLLPADAVYIAQADAAAQLAEIGADDPGREYPYGIFLGGAPVPLPTETFEDSYTLEVGNQVVELTYNGTNHSPGNTYVYFPNQRALMLVDVVFPGWVPFMSLALAQDVHGYIQAHEEALAYDFDTFIGGHLTRLGTREDVETALAYLMDVRANAAAALQSVDFMAVAMEVGFTDLWVLFGAYLDTVAQTCADTTLVTWDGQLGGAASFTKSHCATMLEDLRIN